MNICIITGIFPPDIGGPATYVSRLAGALLGEGHGVSVVTLGDDSLDFPFPVLRISRRLPLPVRLLKLFFVLVREGRSADVWYINGLELPAVLAGKLLRKRLVMKVVGDYAWERAMNHALTSDLIDEFQEKSQQWKVEAHKRLRAWLAKQVDTLITPSRYLKQLVQRWGVPGERIQVIYNAVEEPVEDLVSPQDIRKELELSERDRVLVTIGRLVSWKGVDQLLKLLPQLDPEVKLLVVGDGPERNSLTKLTEDLKLSSRVKFVGKASRYRALSYIKASDVFVLNTAYEGFSHVLLEAMMLGAPVLTTSVCGNPELITTGKNGLLVEYGNLVDLKTQLIRLLENYELQQRFIYAGKHSLQQFTWDKLLSETCHILQDESK